MSFTGKVVLVTGASTGIGAGIAIAFAKEGASLALTARNSANLEKTKKDCLAVALKGIPDPFLITADLLIEDDIVKIITETINKFGKLDVLVNNAGANRYQNIQNLSLADYDFTLNLNLRAPYQLTNLAIPYLEKTQGNIVNISSISGTRPFSHANAYGAAKAGLDQFTRCTAVELAPKKIRVNAISPGLIISNFQKSAGMSDEDYAKYIEGTKQSYPLGRPGEPEDVAEAVIFIASEKAKFITGVVLPVDGGKSCV